MKCLKILLAIAVVIFGSWSDGSIAADYDVVIVNARIADGTGAVLITGDVAIKNGRVAAIGRATGEATTRIDARGRVVAPGFIDVHTHSEKIGELPMAENFLRMGVTTIVTGNCGGSRTDVAKFLSDVGGGKVALNVGTLIGHNSVRQKAMGGNLRRPPTEEELSLMKALVAKAMDDGAVGLSTGLIYPPGCFAKPDEIIELARLVAARGGIYVSHMRSETIRIFPALEELVRVARDAGVRAQVSHIKVTGPSAWGKAGEVLALLDRARAGGLSIAHDMYVYTASSTGIAQLIPDEAREGGRADFIARIDDPSKKAEIMSEMKRRRELLGRTDYAYAVIAKFKADPSLNGKTIPQAAKLVRGSDSIEDQVELIFDIERRGGGSAIYHGMNEPDVATFLRHPLTMIASDGAPCRFGEDLPHPRSYGNNARVLGRYVRELRLLKLEEAIRRMSSLPAATYRLEGRGVLKPGAHADVVIFDPDRVGDLATFENPHQYATGFDHVLVNGVPVIRDGSITGSLPGEPIRMGLDRR